MAEKRFYWIQLKEGFFKQKEIKKLRKIAGGDTYTIIYLKMLLAAVRQGDMLFYEGVEDSFPEELALELDEDPENVKVTLAFLERQGLMKITGEDEFLLTQCAEMTGSESESAARVRRYREKKALQCNTDVTAMLRNGNIDIEIDKEKDIYICPEQNSGQAETPFIKLPLNTGEHPVFQRDLEEYRELYPAVDVPQAMRDMRGWLLANPKRRKTSRGIGRFINSWLAREQDKGGKTVGYNAHTPNKFNQFQQNDYDFERLEVELVANKAHARP